MVDREKVLCALENCTQKIKCRDCPWEECESEHNHFILPAGLVGEAITLLKEQEAHIVTETDFENADTYGFLPAWCEERYANDVYCECIKKEALHEVEMRYWTAKPSKEQRKAVKWE